MFLLKIRKSRRTRYIAMFLAINILAEIVSPSVMMALTTGPSQPEVQSFEPISTSEMVDLFSGDFKYNIPLMDVGGYPLNINYNSGVGMDQEATWVGLGWNLNVGAITRNMRGLPDDFNGTDAVKKEFNMKDNESYGGHLKMGFEIFGWGKLPSGGNSNSGSLTIGLAINYNNYSGIGVTQSAGISMGLQAGKGSAGKMNMGLGISSSASEGLDLNPSVSFSAKADSKGKNDEQNTTTASIGIGMGVNSRSGLKTLSINASVKASQHTYDRRSNTEGSASNSGSSSGAVNFGVSTYVPSIQFPMTTNAVAINFKLGGHVFGADVSGDIGGYYSNQHLSTRELSLPAYGYLYSDAGQDNDNGLMDFNREKDGAYNRNMQKLPITNFTYDVYNVAGQGIGGTYRPFRHDIGYVFDNESRTTSDSYTLGGEVDLGNVVHAGIDISVVDVNTIVGKWSEQNNAKNKLSFRSSTPNSTDEKFAFKEVGEKSVDEDQLFDNMGGYSPVRVGLTGSGLGVSADDALQYFYPSGGPMANPTITSNTRSYRHKRNQVISTLTYDEAKVFGLETSLYTSGISGARPHHIAEITVTKTDGSRYIYGLPAYNKEQVEATFNVTGNSTDLAKGIVTVSGSDDSNGNSKGNDNYFNRVTTPAYAHAHMLTAVVSSDYVDSDGVPGPTDGDLGNYTKFSYSKVSDFQWRTPVSQPGTNQANYNENTKKASIGDDYGSYVSGKKDMYYVSEIVTKNYIAIFTTEDREDALEVLQNDGTPSTVHKSRLLKNIKLYSKPEYNKQIAPGSTFIATPIKVVNFVYNYDLCPGVPNNSGASLTGSQYPVGQVNNHGKLTLKQIYFTYGSSDKAKLNTYDFSYNSATNYTYHSKAYDRWGNYKPIPAGATDITARYGCLPNWEFPYVDQSSQTTADNNSSAWSLSTIKLPSGADINIDYESDDYAYVQNLPAMNMCKVTNIVSSLPDSNTPLTGQTIEHLQSGNANLGAGTSNQYLVFELPRPVNVSTASSNANYFQNNVLKDMTSGRFMYFRFLVNLTKIGSSISQNFGDYFEYVSGYAELESGYCGFVPTSGVAYTHGYVKLRDVQISKNNSSVMVNPIAKAAWQMGRVSFPNLVWDASFNPNGGPADVIKALIQSDFTQNIIDAIKGPNLAIASKGYGSEVIMGKSWVRLYNADGRKFGGGCRVKKITINDNWDEMTHDVSGEHQRDFTYGQTYEYTTEENGRTISSGVAAYEPMIGGDEIPQRLPNYYTNQGNNPEIANFLVPSDQFFTEEPYGESFYPAASVGYSKIKVANLKRTDPNNPNTKIVKAHATGYVIHKFYTAKDYPTLTKRTLIDKKTFKPAFGGLLKIFARDFMTVTQGHLVEVNDMHGKPRGMEVYAEDKPNQPISTVEYKYKTQGPSGYEEPSYGDYLNDAKLKANKLDNNCNIIKPDGSIASARIGVDYDMVADFRESKTTTVMGGAQINLSAFLLGMFPGAVPTIWPDFSRDVTRFRSAVTTKVIYRYGILEKTIATDLGSKVETSNLAYDSETGEVLLTKTQNNFEDPIYSFNFPAHWSYDLMGQAYKNIGSLVTHPSAVSDPSTIFCVGDEVAINSTTKGWVCDVSSSSLSIIDASGTPITITSSTEIKILRSGRRNQQSTSIGSVVSLANPIDIDGDGNINYTSLSPSNKISFGGSASNSKVIKTGAVEYADHWQIYPGWKENTESGCSCILTQQGFDFYNMANTLLVNNVFYPPWSTVSGTPLYDANTSTFYNGFTPSLFSDCGNYKSYYWSFYSTPGSNLIDFHVLTSSGIIPECNTRCSISATLPTGMYWNDIKLTSLNSYSIITSPSGCAGQLQICANYLVDTTSAVPEGVARTNFINFPPSTVCFTVTGSTCYNFVQCETTTASSTVCPPNINDKVNPFYVGIKGNWRMLKSWSYLSDRSQTLTGSASTKNTNIRKDGTLASKDFMTGTPIAFQPFWKLTAGNFVKDPTYWTYTSEVTKYSPYGPELENVDALGRYSSAIYGYNESLPLAVGSNARLQEIAYDGFEDYDFINPSDCKKKHFNFYENKSKRKSTQSHTGNYSMEVLQGTSVVAKRKLPTACTYSVNPLCTYSLTCSDFLPLFSPTAQKYVLSYWVKEVKSGTALSVPILTYNYSSVYISTTTSPLTLSAPVKTAIIDGWQRVECTFDLPSYATGEIFVSLNNTASSNLYTSYFDDIRIHPFNSNIKTFVYNPVTLKYTAELDANNFATFYEYNEEGSLIRVKKETEKGIMTIQETKNHTKH